MAKKNVTEARIAAAKVVAAKKADRAAQALAARKAALRDVAAFQARLGPDLFSWATRKHLAIRAAERAKARIEKEASEKIARLQRVSAF